MSSENPSGLSQAERALLRERLERARDDLQARLQRQAAVAEESEPLSEPMDAAEQTREQDDAIAFTERDRKLMLEIEHALAKFETGRYGVSELSGQPIGFRRLEILPWARITADEAETS